MTRSTEQHPSAMNGPLAPLCGFVCVLGLASAAHACDGKSYSYTIAVGSNVSGGGLTVRLDRAKLRDPELDKYYISVKDDGQVLADHVVLVQRDTISLKTRCGMVSIGADRGSVFSHGMLKINWSYF
jgi:hypothetical protein